MKSWKRGLSITTGVMGSLFTVAMKLYETGHLHMKWGLYCLTIMIIALMVRLAIGWVDNHPAVRIGRKGWNIFTNWRKNKSPTPPPPPRRRPPPPTRGPVVVDPSDPRTIILDPSEPEDPDDYRDPTARPNPPKQQVAKKKFPIAAGIIGIILVLLSAAIVGSITAPTPTPKTTTARKTEDRPSPSASKSDTKGKQVETPAPVPEKKDNTAGYVAIIATLVGLVIITVALFYKRDLDHKKKVSGRPPDADEPEPESIWDNPAISAGIILIVANVLALGAIGHWIVPIANHAPWLFVFANLGTVLIAFLFSSGRQGHGFAAKGLVGIILLGVASTLIGLVSSSDTAQEAREAIEETVTPTPAPKIDHPVLGTIAPHAPEKFDAPEKVVEATQEYREQGLEPHLDTAQDWGPKLTVQEFTIAYIEVQPGRLSRVVKVPPTVGGYKTHWVGNNGDYKLLVNGKYWVSPSGSLGAVLRTNQQETKRWIETIQAKGTGSRPAKVRLYMAK